MVGLQHRIPCKGNCGREIRLDHPKGVLSWNKSGYCRKCLKKLMHVNLKAKIRKEREETKNVQPE